MRAHFCLVTLVVFHVEHNQANIKPFTIFPHMKKTFFIILSLAVYSLALDCVNLATFGQINTLPNARPDSASTYTLIRTLVGEELIETFVPRYNTRKIVWNGNTLEKTINYEGSDIDSLKVKSTVSQSITIERDGDKIYAIYGGEGSKYADTTYISQDSSYGSSSTRGYKNGSSYETSRVEKRVVRNDSLFVLKSFFESGSDYFSRGYDGYLITHDPDNKDQCIEKIYHFNDDDSMDVKDNILSIYTIEETDNGFVTTRKMVNDSTIYKVFYVYNEMTTSIHHKVRPAVNYKNAKHFDLLGRPANSKYIIKVNR